MSIQREHDKAKGKKAADTKYVGYSDPAKTLPKGPALLKSKDCDAARWTAYKSPSKMKYSFRPRTLRTLV